MKTIRTSLLYGSIIMIMLLSSGCWLGTYATIKPNELSQEKKLIDLENNHHLKIELERLLHNRACSNHWPYQHANTNDRRCRISFFDSNKFRYTMSCEEGRNYSVTRRDGGSSTRYDRLLTYREPATYLCPAKLEQRRQLPFLTIYYSVNETSFGGNKDGAIRAYSILKKLCD